MTYQLLFFNASVQSDIQDWPTQIFASFVRIAEQMEVSGPNLGLPYTKAMGGGLFEIRARGSAGIGRAFFLLRERAKDLGTTRIYQENPNNAKARIAPSH